MHERWSELSVRAAGQIESSDTDVWENICAVLQLFIAEVTPDSDPAANAARWKLESSKSSRSLEMHRDLAKEMLERLFTRHKTEWENFMGFPCPGSLSLNWECEA